MKKTMKWTALLCAVVLLATLLGGCSVVDSGKLLAVEFLVNQGQYEIAYQLLRDLEGEEAEEWKNKLVFMPLSRVEYDGDNNKTTSTNYRYDEKGYPAMEQYVDEAEIHSKTTTYAYNDDGKLLFRQFDGGEYSERYTATYDERGNCLTEETVNSDQTESKYTYTYDTNGQLLTTTYEGKYLYDGMWEMDSHTTTYTRDEKGNPLSESIIDSDGTWVKRTYTYTYAYNEEGDWLTCEEEVYDYVEDQNGYKTWSTQFITYGATYDAAGNQLTYTEERGNGSWERHTYTYDAAGNQLTERCETNDSGWYQYTYTYDADGNRVKDVCETGEGGYQQNTYTYDEDGNLLTDYYVSDSGYWIRYAYTYDEKGNRIREDYEASEEESSVKTFEYDQFGNCLVEEVEGVSREETEWQLMYYPNGRPVTEV